MRKNVIILTSGLSGSSVLTSLITKEGYWPGQATFKKKDYDTFENDKLIELNLTIFDKVGYQKNYTTDFSNQIIHKIASLYNHVDHTPFRVFTDTCNAHRPWIWKDPRLWLTIRFWKHFLDLHDCQFIFLTRDSLQVWISATLRRQIQTYSYSKNYNAKVQRSILNFFEKNHLPYLHLIFEDLLLYPRQTIDKINRYLDTNLTLRDLQQIYNKRLYKKSRSWHDLLKAVLIFLKNYSECHR